MINVFCFGYGQVAKNFIKKLSDENIEINLNFTSRKIKDKKIKNLNNAFDFNDDFYDPNIIPVLKKADYILVSIPPVGGKDIVLKNFSNEFKNLRVKWITYLSATSVYGNHDGKWVDENSFTIPTSENGINRLAAEKKWISVCKKLNLPVQIFRLSGIYSNTSNIIKRLKLGDIKIIDKKNHFFSRIHVDDVGNILFKSIDNFKNNEIYNICDDKPASQIEVAAYGAKLLKLEKPNLVKLEEVESEMLRNFYKDSKKVDNKKMKEFFNHKLKYPTYVEGLKYIFNNTF